MRRCFFKRHIHSPATDTSVQHLLRCGIQVDRQQGLWNEALVRVANQQLAAGHGWLTGVIPHGRVSGHFYLAGVVALSRRDGQLAPRRLLSGLHSLQGRTPVVFQPGSADVPRFTGRGGIEDRKLSVVYQFGIHVPSFDPPYFCAKVKLGHKITLISCPVFSKVANRRKMVRRQLLSYMG